MQVPALSWVGGVDATRAKRDERDASRATPEDVQPETTREMMWRISGTRAKRGERDANRATPEDVQPDTDRSLARDVAGWTGLEPAASGVTGRALVPNSEGFIGRVTGRRCQSDTR